MVGIKTETDVNFLEYKTLTVTSTAFENNGYMPVAYTGYGADNSPPLALKGLTPEAKSLAVTMVDLDIPFMREYPHWVIWNIPVVAEIPQAIPLGTTIPELGGAKQGIGYGIHQYKGPKPPKFIRSAHRYVFTVYVLDTLLELGEDTKKNDLLQAMQGHILQQGTITGLYKN